MELKRRKSAAVVLLLILSAAACSDRETKLAKLSSYLSSGLQAAIDTQLVLHRDKVISDDESRSIGEAILVLNSSGKKFNDWLLIYRNNKLNADMSELQKLLAGIQQGTQGLAAAIHVKNPEAQKRLDIILNTLNLALNLAIELQKPAGGA